MNKMETLALDQAEYARFRDFILDRTGLCFADKRRSDLERGLHEGLRDSGLPSLNQYLNTLMAGGSSKLLDRLVSFLTVGETYFNRDASQFNLLRQEILPKLIESRIATTRTLRIWSAGCSTGEEPYSLAILLRELIPYIETWDVTILATDINLESLRLAREGRYGQWSFRNMPSEWLDKYFFVSNTSAYHLSDTIKDQVTLEHVNLKESVYPSFSNQTVDLDLIVCRNVMIYFDDQTTADVMTKFHSCIGDGGWLLVGASDPIPPKQLFRARNLSSAFVYQKQQQGFEARKRSRTNAKVVARPRAKAIEKKKLPKKKVRPSINELLSEAEAMLELGQQNMAAAKASRILEVEPNSAPTLLLMGRIELARNDLGQAVKYLDQAIAIDKLNAHAYYLRSAIHQSAGDDAGAIKALKNTIFLDSAFITAHFTLACLYKQRGQDRLANKGWENVLRLMSDRDKDEIVPDANGVTFGKLEEIVKANLKQETE